jgi:alcohol dehydrogenase class IV
MLPEFYQFHHPTKVIYGEGLVNDFAHEVEELGVKNYFLVSDDVINGLGLIQPIRQGLEENGFTITGEFYDVPQDASVEAVEAISRLAMESGAQGLLAVGGGSVIDATKAANAIFSQGGDLVEDYSGAATLTKPLKPFIAIPTTAGTGSENTIIAMVYDAANRTKLAFADKFLLPDLAVLDPLMTQSMPPGLTASTGMDALTHAVESYVGIDASPHSEALAVAAIKHIFNYLVRATKEGSDLEARGGMLIAANMAGSAFTHSMVGCVHSMAHAVGGLTRVPHGVANAILLPHGMAYNFEVSKEKFAKLAPVMGVDIAGLSVDEAARAAIAAVKDLIQQLNALDAIPVRLRDAGVPQESLPAIAEAATEDGSVIYNPREVEAKQILIHLNEAY